MCRSHKHIGQNGFHTFVHIDGWSHDSRDEKKERRADRGPHDVTGSLDLDGGRTKEQMNIKRSSRQPNARKAVPSVRYSALG
jgi:hypothetical protein